MEKYVDQIQFALFQDFGHAWIYVTLIFLVATWIIRWLLTGRIKKASRRVSSKNMKAIRSAYLFKSISGWTFYALSLGLFVLYWYARFYQFYGLQDDADLFAVMSGALFLLALITHLTLFASVCLEQIKLLEDKQLNP